MRKPCSSHYWALTTHLWVLTTGCSLLCTHTGRSHWVLTTGCSQLCTHTGYSHWALAGVYSHWALTTGLGGSTPHTSWAVAPGPEVVVSIPNRQGTTLSWSDSADVISFLSSRNFKGATRTCLHRYCLTRIVLRCQGSAVPNCRCSCLHTCGKSCWWSPALSSQHSTVACSVWGTVFAPLRLTHS